MVGARASATVRLALAAVVVAAALVSASRLAQANGAETVEEPLTKFERFQLRGCSPCMNESIPVVTLPIPGVRGPTLSRSAAARTSRPGEVGVEIVRSSQLGRPARHVLALRVTLSVASGSSGDVYRIAVGVVDEEEVASLVESLGEISQATSAPTFLDAGTESVDVAVQSGSLRLGVVRVRAESMAFVQAGDVRLLARRPVWEAPATLYLPVSQLPALTSAIGQAAARIRTMRGGQ